MGVAMISQKSEVSTPGPENVSEKSLRKKGRSARLIIDVRRWLKIK